MVKGIQRRVLVHWTKLVTTLVTGIWREGKDLSPLNMWPSCYNMDQLPSPSEQCWGGMIVLMRDGSGSLTIFVDYITV